MVAGLSLVVAFLAGVVSFASPCCLPMVPVYVGYMVGTTQPDDPHARMRALRQGLAFVTGFVVVFVALWASVGVVGYLLRDYVGVLRVLGGIVLIVMGLHFAGLVDIPLLYREARLPVSRLVATPAGAASGGATTGGTAARGGDADAAARRSVLTRPGYARSALLGVVFAAGWTPCVGPILGAIIGLASVGDSVAQGALLLVVYGLGLGLPFLLVAVGAAEANRRLQWLRTHHTAVSLATGGLLMVVGFLLITDLFTRLSGALPALGMWKGFAMSHDLQARPHHDGEPPVDGLDGVVHVEPTDLLRRVWRFLISMRTGLALMLLLGAGTLIGTLLPQAPPGLAADPAAYDAWVDSLGETYGGWTGVFETLGFFTVFSTFWFKAVALVLSLSILACSANRAPRLWRHATRPQTHMSEGFFTAASLHDRTGEPDEGPEQAAEDVAQVLRHHHFRTIGPTVEDGGVVSIYGDRYRWGPFGTVVAHLSVVLILIGMVLTATTGFKDDDLAVPVGTTVEVGHGTGLSVEATNFADTYYADGSPSDYASDLVLYENGLRVHEQTVRVNQPMRYGGVSFFQSFFGIAASMTVRDGATAVYEGGVPLTWQSDDGTHDIGTFAIPDRGYTVYVVSPSSGQVDPGIKAGQVQVEVYDSASESDQPTDIRVLSQGTPDTVAGLEFTFERTRRFTGLIASRDPGTPFVWVGSALLVAGIFLVFFFPHRRIWVRVRASGRGSDVRVASALRRDLAFESVFHRIAHDIRSAGPSADAERK